MVVCCYGLRLIFVVVLDCCLLLFVVGCRWLLLVVVGCCWCVLLLAAHRLLFRRKSWMLFCSCLVAVRVARCCCVRYITLQVAVMYAICVAYVVDVFVVLCCCCVLRALCFVVV